MNSSDHRRSVKLSDDSAAGHVSWPSTPLLVEELLLKYCGAVSISQSESITDTPLSLIKEIHNQIKGFLWSQPSAAIVFHTNHVLDMCIARVCQCRVCVSVGCVYDLFKDL